MSYLVEVERYGRKEYEFETERFTRDLAAALGGEYLSSDCNRGSIKLGAEELTIYSLWNGRGRVECSMYAPDVPHSDRNYYSADHKTAEATVSSARPIEKIAADIRRRVIEASAAALANQRMFAGHSLRGRSQSLPR